MIRFKNRNIYFYLTSYLSAFQKTKAEVKRKSELLFRVTEQGFRKMDDSPLT